MRERASASGGTLEAGPRPRGGFLVRVRVPLSSPGSPASPGVPVGPGVPVAATPSAEPSTDAEARA